MADFFIRRLKISNFKSIDTLLLENVSPFAVFAGANGSGKSNFFDALSFVSLLVRFGVQEALRQSGGYEAICPQSQYDDGLIGSFEFEFEIDIEFACENIPERYLYQLKVAVFKNNPHIIQEALSRNHQLVFNRKKALIEKADFQSIALAQDYSGLVLISSPTLNLFLRNIRLYRIDPNSSKALSSSEQDATELHTTGNNLASVLMRIEDEKPEFRNIILEWMETIVPGIEKIDTERQKLDGKTAVLFKETTTERPFPAHMVSDGTLYSLCLLVAILDSPKYGLTLIEEPERGLHPKAIHELVSLMREYSRPNSPIWLTTHSEAVVRALQVHELWLVDKPLGKTQIKNVGKQVLTDADLAPLGLDKAWLANLLGGGLPW